MIDNPTICDNRNYVYDSQVSYFRAEYPIILDWVCKGSLVIDYCCGDGLLLDTLKKMKDCSCTGVELSESAVEIVRSKGFEVISGRADEKHLEIPDKKFDYSICNVSVQMVMYPEILLMEMARVSKYQIISFPNFANYKNRLDLFFNGRMPRPLLYGYKWYSTGHIHQFSIKDFYNFCNERGFEIIKFEPVIKKSAFYNLKRKIISLLPNVFADTCVFLLKQIK